MEKKGVKRYTSWQQPFEQISEDRPFLLLLPFRPNVSSLGLWVAWVTPSVATAKFIKGIAHAISFIDH